MKDYNPKYQLKVGEFSPKDLSLFGAVFSQARIGQYDSAEVRSQLEQAREDYINQISGRRKKVLEAVLPDHGNYVAATLAYEDISKDDVPNAVRGFSARQTRLGITRPDMGFVRINDLSVVTPFQDNPRREVVNGIVQAAERMIASSYLQRDVVVYAEVPVDNVKAERVAQRLGFRQVGNSTDGINNYWVKSLVKPSAKSS